MCVCVYVRMCVCVYVCVYVCVSARARARTYLVQADALSNVVLLVGGSLVGRKEDAAVVAVAPLFLRRAQHKLKAPLALKEQGKRQDRMS